MSTVEKVELAQEARGEFGLRAALAELELPRSTWYSWYYHQRPERRSYEEKYAHLQDPLEQIARRHPGYGYRRAGPELREHLGHPVNHKVLRRLKRCWDLPLLRATRTPKRSGIQQAIHAAGKRANLVASLEGIQALEVLYTDFTELLYASERAKAQLIPILDHASKFVLGWAVGESATTELALLAGDRAILSLGELGHPVAGLIVHHDQDSVFTSHAWTARVLLEHRARLSYALRGARDNPEMESFFGRFKVENRSLLLDAETLGELKAVVAQRIAYHNHDRRHSSLAHTTPAAFLSRWRRGRRSQS